MQCNYVERLCDSSSPQTFTFLPLSDDHLDRQALQTDLAKINIIIVIIKIDGELTPNIFRLRHFQVNEAKWESEMIEAMRK